MNIFDTLNTTYTFRLQIERNDRTILETAIAAKADAAEVAKAKNAIQQLLNEYTPTIQPPKPVPAPEPAQADTQPQAEPEAQDSPAQAPEAEQRPEDTAEAAAPRAYERPPRGAKDLLWFHCKKCGDTFGTFLRARQTEVPCKCGRQIDLTGHLGRYHFICPYCQHEGWGMTNSEDPKITVRCKCGGDVDLRWNPKAREYQN